MPRETKLKKKHSASTPSARAGVDATPAVATFFVMNEVYVYINARTTGKPP